MLGLQQWTKWIKIFIHHRAILFGGVGWAEERVSVVNEQNYLLGERVKMQKKKPRNRKTQFKLCNSVCVCVCVIVILIIQAWREKMQKDTFQTGYVLNMAHLLGELRSM